MEYLYLFGEILLILALLGLLALPVWLVLTALHVKNQTVGHAKRLSQRPISAVKNLIATGKGIAQQETVRAKRVAGKGKATFTAVKGSALEIRGAAQTVHPEELKPATETLGTAANVAKIAIGLASGAAKQEAR